MSIIYCKLLVNVFLGTSFDPKIEPSSGHYTRTVKIEILYIVRRDMSPFYIKSCTVNIAIQNIQLRLDS
jgi:hypothetical protein